VGHERHAPPESDAYHPPVSSPDVIVSERLELWLATPAQLAALRGGDASSVAQQLNATLSEEWVADVRWLAGFRLLQLTEHPDHAPWLFRAVVLKEPRTAIGHVNFHGPPDDRGVAEIGYSLLPAFRGQGYAIEAVRAMFDWARREHGVRRFRASVSPDNERSQHLIGKLGFVRIGEQWDEEDGLEWVFETA
jgi:RimJ/RimL family protein N-acetyltransferase